MSKKELNLMKYDYESPVVDMNNVVKESFYDNYNQLLKWIDEWKMKLDYNLSKFESENEKISHLKSVKGDIEYEFKPKNRQDLIDPYLEYYNLEIENFPFLRYLKIQTVLSKKYTEQTEPIHIEINDQKIDPRSIKLDFFEYAFNLELLNLIDFIDGRLPGIGIFQTKSSEKIFNDLLKHLNIGDKIERGDQAKLAGIWQSHNAQKFIFKNRLLRKDYFKYINKRFGENYETRRFSIGDNHIETIDVWLSENYFA